MKGHTQRLRANENNYIIYIYICVNLVSDVQMIRSIFMLNHSYKHAQGTRVWTGLVARSMIESYENMIEALRCIFMILSWTFEAKCRQIIPPKQKRQELPCQELGQSGLSHSKELTYSMSGKGKSSSNVFWEGICSQGNVYHHTPP